MFRPGSGGSNWSLSPPPVFSTSFEGFEVRYGGKEWKDFAIGLGSIGVGKTVLWEGEFGLMNMPAAALRALMIVTGVREVFGVGARLSARLANPLPAPACVAFLLPSRRSVERVYIVRNLPPNSVSDEFFFCDISLGHGDKTGSIHASDLRLFESGAFADGLVAGESGVDGRDGYQDSWWLVGFRRLLSPDGEFIDVFRWRYSSVLPEASILSHVFVRAEYEKLFWSSGGNPYWSTLDFAAYADPSPISYYGSVSVREGDIRIGLGNHVFALDWSPEGSLAAAQRTFADLRTRLEATPDTRNWSFVDLNGALTTGLTLALSGVAYVPVAENVTAADTDVIVIRG